MRKLAFLILFSYTYFAQSYAQTTVTSANNGDWHNGSTWSTGTIPNANDSVIIAGHEVTIAASTQVANIKIDGGPNANSKLTINGSITVTTGQMDIERNPGYSDPIEKGVYLYLFGNAVLNITGHLNLTRGQYDRSTQTISIVLNNAAQINVGGDLKADYAPNNFNNHRLNSLLALNDQSSLTITNRLINNVGGFSTLTMDVNSLASLTTHDFIVNKEAGGEYYFNYNSSSQSTVLNNLTLNGVYGTIDSDAGININLNNGNFDVNSNFNVNSDNLNRYIKVNINNSSTVLNVNGDFNFDVLNGGILTVGMTEGSTIALNGQFNRIAGNGQLNMDGNSRLVLTGTNIQIPPNHIAGSNDTFNLSNVVVQSPNNNPIYLSDTVRILNEFSINTIIHSTASDPLILEESGSIVGGSTTAYIDGPVEKRGAAAAGLMLPLGDQGMYAPLEIAPYTGANAYYRAEYHRSARPSAPMEAGIESIPSDQHWTVERGASTTPTDMTLYWSDEAHAGVSAANNYDVIYLDESQTNPQWRSIGNGGMTFQSGGNLGSISSELASCPPPIGIITVTIGQQASLNGVLPVEFTSFEASGIDRKVLLEWSTATETDASHYEIQHSTDGFRFEVIGEVTAAGNSTTAQQYDFIHAAPIMGRNYYRLRQVDLDGMSIYTNLQSVNLRKADGLAVAPNPVNDYFRLIGMDPSAASGQVEVFDQYGQMIGYDEVAINNGEALFNPSSLNIMNQGIYYVKVTTGNKTTMAALVKQ